MLLVTASKPVRPDSGNATGYDHNFCLNTFKDGKGDDTQVCASLYSPKTGIFMEMYTNEPGVQVYSEISQGVGADADIVRKHGIKYPKHVSVCLGESEISRQPQSQGLGTTCSEPR